MRRLALGLAPLGSDLIRPTAWPADLPCEEEAVLAEADLATGAGAG
eukprot:CAMPEP_0181069896 /NCGR_PEP_ID=MMETSP1070-20121207/27192_1 /TAXON_ID=265543 /ORGANISM="Minutocellus polymorphus, Strain NH13" /LENGTH=45 /DNA_ID= /DNA_START= /DNA_END= /DNA_ORIENTATION=